MAACDLSIFKDVRGKKRNQIHLLGTINLSKVNVFKQIIVKFEINLRGGLIVSINNLDKELIFIRQ